MASRLMLVNPHIIPFMDTNPFPDFFSRSVYNLAGMIRSEFQHRIHQVIPFSYYR